MQAFMRNVADSPGLPPPPQDGDREHWWADEVQQYKCLQPMGGRDTSEVKKALAALTGTSSFPAPHSCPLTVDDLWKLSHFKYKACFRGQGLRMLLCFLHVQGRTVSALVSENMMVMRVSCGKVPYVAFKGSVLLGYAVHGEDGSAQFEALDCLFAKGVNLGRQLWEPRRQACIDLLHDYTPDGSGFALSLVQVADAGDEAFWQQAAANPEWRTILFVPERRALKMAAAQSTLFELSSLDWASVKENMTQQVLKNSHAAEFLPSFKPAPKPKEAVAHTFAVSLTLPGNGGHVPIQELEEGAPPPAHVPDGAAADVGDPAAVDRGAEVSGPQPAQTQV